MVSYLKMPQQRHWKILVNFLCVSAAILTTTFFLVARADQDRRVDLELLLAIDVSHSITEQERSLQVQGVATAFRDPRLINAISTGNAGSIAVAMIYWSSDDKQVIAADWAQIGNAEDAHAFARSVEAATMPDWPPLTYTAIGSALNFGAASFQDNGFAGDRRVIDISADDPSNQGPKAADVRDRLVGDGFIINGLPVLTERHEVEDKEALVQHFESDVSGGIGAFVLPAESFEDYPKAMLSKLILEISGLQPTRRVASKQSLRQ